MLCRSTWNNYWQDMAPVIEANLFVEMLGFQKFAQNWHIPETSVYEVFNSRFPISFVVMNVIIPQLYYWFCHDDW